MTDEGDASYLRQPSPDPGKDRGKDILKCQISKRGPWRGARMGNEGALTMGSQAKPRGAETRSQEPAHLRLYITPLKKSWRQRRRNKTISLHLLVEKNRREVAEIGECGIGVASQEALPNGGIERSLSINKDHPSGAVLCMELHQETTNL